MTTPWETSLPVDPGVWRRQVLTVWHFSFAMVVTVSTLIMVDRHAPVAAYLVMGAYAVGYVYLMAPAMQKPEGYRAYVFLALTFATVATLALIAPGGLVILYVAFPHFFAVLDRFRTKLAGVAVTAAAAFAGSVAHDGASGGSFLDAFVTVAAALLTSLGMGFVTAVLIRESERRGKLIGELERTRAELAEANHEAGVLAERQRMAREIHDTLAQGFTSLLMLVQAADASLDTDPEGTRRRLDLAARTARENLAEARALVAAQDPVELGGGSLAEALGRAVAGLAEELDIAADFRVAGTPRDLPAATQVVLVRTLQECLANIRKHAGATEVHAELAYRPIGVRLTVADNGRGFALPRDGDHAAAAAGTSGYGLRGMRARIEQARGTLDIAGAPGAGTTVCAEVP